MSVTDPFAMRTPHSSSAHVASVEILHSPSCARASAMQVAKALYIPLCFGNLFLKSQRSLIDGLQLREVRVQDTYNLRNLHEY